MPRACFTTGTLVLLVVAASVGDARPGADGTPAQTNRALRVATGPKPPFVLKENGALTGFSVDLWQDISRRLGREFAWVELGTGSEQLEAIIRGDADVAISAIDMTPEREKRVDFSTSYFDSGLQIMVPARLTTPILRTLQTIASSGIRELAIAALVIVFCLANVLWLVERRTNSRFQKGYARGILEGCWGVVLIIATGEHGDREAPGVIKRLTVTAMWLFGVILIAQFTATVTSSLTVHQLHSSIEGPGDLPGKRVGIVPGTVAARYLRQLGVEVVDLHGFDEGFELLRQGEVQAIVYDAPTLQYLAARSGRGAVQVVGPVFWPEKYGIAVALGNPLRKQINEALLVIYAEGKYDELRNKWFAAGR